MTRWPAALLGIITIGLIVFSGCGGGDGGTNPGPSEEQLAELREESSRQLDYFYDLADLAAVYDTTAAIDSMVVRLAADENIAWARNALTAVTFQWKSGRPGILVIDPRARKPVGTIPPGASRPVAVHAEPAAPDAASGGEAASPAEDAPVIPKGRASIFLAPCYSEFELWDDSLVGHGDTCLAKAGYSSFTLYDDEKCTLGLLRSLGSKNVGMLRISSHGVPWPGMTDVQEVYLITGEVATDAANAANFKALNETYSIIIGSYAGENRYFVSSDFFKDEVDFGDNKPFVSIGFCFGNLGRWPSTLINNCQAGATTGWDWAVLAHQDWPRVEDFYRDMCDTSRATPLTLATWFATANHTYYDHEDQRDVHLLTAGPANFALWSALRLESVAPVSGQPGDLVTLTGSGFGTVKGRVKFDQIAAASIPQWTNTQIQVQVPTSLNEGQYAVTVEAGGKASNAVTFTVAGDLLEKLHATSLIEIEFNAQHVLAGGLMEGLFSPSLTDLVWDGTNFSGADSIHFEGLSIKTVFSGQVTPDGTTATLTYSRQWWDTAEDGSRTYQRMGATFTAVPYSRDFRETGYQWVEYDPAGAGVSGFVSGMDYESQAWNAAGGLIDADSYQSTNWGAAGVDEYLRIKFGGSGF